MTIEIISTPTAITGVLNGRLDTASSTQFAKDMTPLLNNADKHIVLDCKDLQFISSSGLRLFLTLRKATISQGGDVTIKNASNEIRQVFTITGFNALFNFE